jgi:hypothetical protein
MRRSSCSITLATLGFIASGCFGPEKRVYPRSALEQQVTSVAVERAIAALHLEKRGLPRRLRLRVATPRETDDALVTALLRRGLGEAGVAVVERFDEGLPVLDANVLFAGSDTELSLLGLPVWLPSLVPIAIPDISLWRVETQSGRARLGLVLWSPEGRRLVQVEDAEGEAYFSNFTVLTFIGPFRSTDIEHFLIQRVDEPEGN